MPGLELADKAGSGCGRAVALATYNPDGPKDTGIEEVKNSICEVYPNPVKDLLSVRLNEEGNAHVSIMSTTGKMLFEQNTDCKSLANGINVSQLGKGHLPVASAHCQRRLCQGIRKEIKLYFNTSEAEVSIGASAFLHLASTKVPFFP